MLIPPSEMGETLTLAVGDKTRCQPKAVFGFGGGAKGCILSAPFEGQQSSRYSWQPEHL